jgi:putative ABC transport system permease protein
VALDLGGPDVRDGFRLTEGGARARSRAFGAAARGEAVLVSEPFGYRHGLAAGDRLRLVTREGRRELTVAGVYYDYGADRGAVLLDLALYRRLYRDPAVSGVSARAAPGVEPEELAARLRRATAGVQLLDVRSQRTLRERSLTVFDRTFEITRVLRWLAGLVAFIGVLSALMALQLERSRELGVLRANGLTPGQLWRLVTSQTVLLGVAAGLLALPVGLLLADVMIRVVNRRSFGWTLEMTVAPEILLQALALAVGAAFLAGLFPAWKMSRTSPAVALREE